MRHIFVIKLGHNWFRLWLGAWRAPSHYLNQLWQGDTLILGTNFSIFESKYSFHVITFENAVSKMAIILSLLLSVYWLRLGDATQIAKTLELTSIRYQSYAKVSDRCLIDFDLRVHAIWPFLYKLWAIISSGNGWLWSSIEASHHITVMS